MKHSIILISIILITLTACQVTLPPQSLPAQSYAAYLPLALKSAERRPLIGVVNEVDFGTVDEYYMGDVLKVAYHAGWFRRDGWTYIDRKVSGYDGPVSLLLSGAYPEWVTPTCLPVPELFWDAWLQFAITIIDYVGAPRIIELAIMNEPETSETTLEYYIGCWGEDYASGVYYGRFVNYVVTQLRPRYPHMRFVAGEFMNAPGAFARGFADTVHNIDALSWHAYPYCGTDYAAMLDGRLAQWQAATTLPLHLSEYNLIYPIRTDECDQEQADALEYAFGLRGLEFIGVYSLCENGWMNADICRKPAWDVYESEMMK